MRRVAGNVDGRSGPSRLTAKAVLDADEMYGLCDVSKKLLGVRDSGIRRRLVLQQTSGASRDVKD